MIVLYMGEKIAGACIRGSLIDHAGSKDGGGGLADENVSLCKAPTQKSWSSRISTIATTANIK